LPRVQDVAAYILNKKGPQPKERLTAMLVYAQGWSLAWRGTPLYRESIFHVHGELYIPGLCEDWSVEDWIPALPDASMERLTCDERQVLDAVLEWYETHPEADDVFRREIAREQFSPAVERSFSSEREKPSFSSFIASGGMGLRVAAEEISFDVLRRYFEAKLVKYLSQGWEVPGLFYLMCLLSRHRMHTDDLLEIRVWQEMNPIGREMW